MTSAGPEDLVLEVMYFAGGIKAKHYGSSVRPEWVPPAEQVGLQNDVYLAPGQFALDFSRFQYADKRTRAGAAHWFGVYGYAKDLYGDRGNFCGVGVWVSGWILPDVEDLYDMLLKLVDVLQTSGLTDSGPSAEFDEIALRAVDFASSPQMWVGSIGPSEAAEVGSAYGSRAAYVVLDKPFGPGLPLSMDLVLAVDALVLVPPAPTTPRVLFLPPGEINFDSRVSSDRIFRGVQRLFDGSPKSSLLRSLLNGQASLSDQLSSAHASARQANESAAQFANDAKEARDKMQQLLDQSAERLSPPMPAISSGEFFDRFVEILQGQLQASRATAQTKIAQPSLRIENDNAHVAKELAAIKSDLRRLLESAGNANADIPRSWSDHEAAHAPTRRAFSLGALPLWIPVGVAALVAGIVAVIVRH